MIAFPIALGMVTLLVGLLTLFDWDLRRVSLGFLIATGVMVLWAVILGGNGCNRGYSDGERSGYIVKISRKGVFYKSFEGALRASGAGPSASSSESDFTFTVVDDKIIEDVLAAQRGGYRVTLRYVEWLSHPVMRMESSYEVVEISKAEEK